MCVLFRMIVRVEVCTIYRVSNPRKLQTSVLSMEVNNNTVETIQMLEQKYRPFT
uniref:Uncharacterized protein n=1 Tax=Octopus bimaculoides TaxID=37653 RepID=A0A0L8HB23_OCTBM